MKNRTILLFTLILIMVVSFIYIRNQNNQIPEEFNNSNLFDVNDDETFNVDLIGYFDIEDEDISTLPSDLKTYLINEIQSVYNPDNCDNTGDNNEDVFDFLYKKFDLNSDEETEYIIMPIQLCDLYMRGASGNGKILIVQSSRGKWNTIGYLNGNGYTITKRKTNNYYDVLVNFHSSANSGSETIYKWTDESKTGIKAQYEPVIAKWYRFKR